MITHTIEPLEVLRRLGDEYRHLEQEHARQPGERSATRHRLEDKLQRIALHFERVLVEWVHEEPVRARWREFLHGRGEAPETLGAPPPPLFKGTNDAGAVIEIRPAGVGYDVLQDGARVDHVEVPWELDPDMVGPVQIGEDRWDETFDASAEAIAALAAFDAGHGEPPWPWARELLEDGLIDAELAITPRGRRRLDRTHPAAARETSAPTTCVVVADAARARVLVLERHPDGGPAIAELVEAAEITNPVLRTRDTDLTSDTRGGRRGGASTPLRPTSDHRDHHRRDLARHFAARIAEEAAGVWRRYPACAVVVVASPVMLGLLRPAIEHELRPKDHVELRELARDLTKLSAPQLHDQLADEGLLPPRGRRPPLQAEPGLPT